MRSIVSRISVPLTVIAAFFICLIHIAPAHAQATRTWVSGVGDDANPCSRTAPCKTWAGAISKTSAGGEIDALDPGGFGGVTITKAITLDGGGGQVASVLVAGTPGITVNAGTSDVIILRNLRLNGLLNSTGPGTQGVNFVSGASLIIDHCNIFGFANNGVNIAVSATSTVAIRNSSIDNIRGNGVNATTSSGLVLVQVSNTDFTGGFPAAAFTGGGVNAAANSFVTVSNSTFNSLAFGAETTSSSANLIVDSSLFTTDTVGVGGTSGATVSVNNNTFTGTTTPLQVAGTFNSTGNNRLIGGTPQNPNGTITVK